MNCNDCGKKISEKSKFCRYCGSKTSRLKPHLIIDDASLEKQSTEVPAGFWIRFGAYMADFAGIVVFAVIIGALETLIGIPEVLSKMGILTDYVFWIIYSTLFLTFLSSTPGKMIYGLRVLRSEGGELDFGTSLKRALLQPLSLLFFGSGYWNMGKNQNEQTWHDKKAGTMVVKSKKNNYIFQILISIIGGFLYLYLRSLPNTP